MMRPSLLRHGLVLAGAGPVVISDIPAAIASAVRLFIVFSLTDAPVSPHVHLQRFASEIVCDTGRREIGRFALKNSDLEWSHAMSTPEDLKEIYTDELKDLWSANDQMKRLLKKITTKASDAKLKEMLQNSVEGIDKHTGVLKELIAGQDEKVSKEHCKGMEGLVEEATKHIVEEGPKKGPLLDVLIIAQYQRMTHYGIAGFGTAAAYAEALGLSEDATKLKDATKEIYGGDEYMTKLAETAVNVEAADA